MLPDPLLTAAGGVVVNAEGAAGVLRFGLWPEPGAAAGRLAAWFERRLNRPQRSARDRRIRGAVLAALLLAAGAGAGLLLARLGAGQASGRLVALVLLTLLVEPYKPFARGRAAARALDAGRLAGPPGAAAPDPHAFARAMIGAIALRLARGVVAPVFWYLLLGLPGLLAYAAADAARSGIADRALFGRAAQRAGAALALVPSAIAGLLLALAAIAVPKGHVAAALRGLGRRPTHQGAVDAGWPLGAAAGALDLALAGPGPAGPAPWVGDGRARATTADLRRMLLLHAAACAALAAGLALAGLAALAA